MRANVLKTLADKPVVCVTLMAALMCLGCGEQRGMDQAWASMRPTHVGTAEQIENTLWRVPGKIGVLFGPGGVLKHGPMDSSQDTWREGTYEVDRGIIAVTWADGQTRRGIWDGDTLVYDGYFCMKLGDGSSAL